MRSMPPTMPVDNPGSLSSLSNALSNDREAFLGRFQAPRRGEEALSSVFLALVLVRQGFARVAQGLWAVEQASWTLDGGWRQRRRPRGASALEPSQLGSLSLGQTNRNQVVAARQCHASALGPFFEPAAHGDQRLAVLRLAGGVGCGLLRVWHGHLDAMLGAATSARISAGGFEERVLGSKRCWTLS